MGTMVKRYGIIKDFRHKEVNGSHYGYIYANDGFEYYVNDNAKITDEVKICPGDFVFFETTRKNDNEKGLFAAYNVRHIQEDNELMMKLLNEKENLDTIVDSLIEFRKLIRYNNEFLSVDIVDILKPVDDEIKVKSNLCKNLMSDKELFDMYSSLIDKGYKKYVEDIRMVLISMLKRVTSWKAAKSIIIEIQPSWYTKSFFEQILNIEIVSKDLSEHIDFIARNNLDKFSTAMQKTIKQTMLSTFKTYIESEKKSDNLLDIQTWNFIKPYFPINAQEYVRTFPNEFQMYYWYEQYINSEADKQIAIEELAKLFNAKKKIQDIKYLPIEAYLQISELDKMVSYQRYQYTKKSLAYLKNLYANNLNNEKYKQILIEAYLFIWEYEYEESFKSYHYEVQSDIENKIKEVKKALVFINDSSFVKRFLSTSYGECLDRDNSISITCFKVGLLKFSDLSVEIQVNTFEVAINRKDASLKELFFLLSETAEIKCLCYMAKSNYLNELDSLSEVFNSNDKKKSSLAYIVYIILTARGKSLIERQQRFSEVMKKIPKYIMELNEKIQKGILKRFELNGLLYKCASVERNNNKEGYCEGQEWNDTVFCPFAYEHRKRCYHGLSCRTVHPNFSGIDSANWFLGEMLQYGELLDKKVINKPLNVVGTIGGYINHCNDMLEHMYCRKCNNIMSVDLKYSKEKLEKFFVQMIAQYFDQKTSYYTVGVKPKAYATSSATVFHCENKDEGHDRNVYLNLCANKLCDNIIDIRDCKCKVDILPYYICTECGNAGPDEQYQTGSICPMCGSYHMITSRYRTVYKNQPKEERQVSIYKCLDCNHEIKVDIKRSIYCPICYQEKENYPDNTIAIHNISSRDGINFHCCRCNTQFVKKIPTDPLRIEHGIKYIKCPGFAVESELYIL